MEVGVKGDESISSFIDYEEWTPLVIIRSPGGRYFGGRLEDILKLGGAGLEIPMGHSGIDVRLVFRNCVWKLWSEKVCRMG